MTLPPQQTIELRANGYGYYQFSLLLWILGFIMAAIGFVIAINRVYVHFDVNSFRELELMFEIWPVLVVVFSSIGLLGVIIAIPMLLCSLLLTSWYSVKEKTVFYYTGGMDRITRIVNTSYYFPHGIEIQEWIVDSVVRISVTQPTFGRMFNCGIIRMTIATFVNANARTTNLTFCGIRSPDTRKDQLMHSIPSKHEGVLVKLYHL